MTESIKVNIDLKLRCNECKGDLELVLQKNETLYIAPCKNGCSEAAVKTGRCYDCKHISDDELSCNVNGGDNLDGCCKLFSKSE